MDTDVFSSGGQPRPSARVTSVTAPAPASVSAGWLCWDPPASARPCTCSHDCCQRTTAILRYSASWCSEGCILKKNVQVLLHEISYIFCYSKRLFVLLSQGSLQWSRQSRFPVTGRGLGRPRLMCNTHRGSTSKDFPCSPTSSGQTLNSNNLPVWKTELTWELMQQKCLTKLQVDILVNESLFQGG